MTKGTKIDVLDKGFVRLVDYMGSDESIVRAARVSYDAAWRAGEDKGSDKRLINYLWKHAHTSPFESVTFTFEIKAPIFVIRQWHRHRTWSYNELSGRYKELKAEFYVPSSEIIGLQSTNNKQARDLVPNPHAEAAIGIMEKAMGYNYEAYEVLLSLGVPRELARSILPVSTYSHMFGTVNLRNLLHFLDLRSADDSQYEIRQYANAIKELIKEIVPVTMEIYDIPNKD